MTISHAPASPVTTQPVAHRLSDYTLNREGIKQNAGGFAVIGVASCIAGGGIGAAFADIGVSSITNPVIGAAIGAPVGFCVVGSIIAGIAHSAFIQLPDRRITGCTALAPLAGGQPQSQELPSEPPPPYPATGPSRTAPVRSQPRLQSSSALPSVYRPQHIDPNNHATSQIVSGSLPEVASGAFRLTSSGSTSLGVPGYMLW